MKKWLWKGAGRKLAIVLVVLRVGGLLALRGWASSQTRIGDLVEIQHARSKELIGYGLVTGLDRTGDRTISSRGSVFTVQSIANMLENFGITVDPRTLRTRNVAAVMVTARGRT